MKLSLLFFSLLHVSIALKRHKNSTIPIDDIKKILEKHEEILIAKTKNKNVVTPVEITNVSDHKFVPVPVFKAKLPPKLIQVHQVQEWAVLISNVLVENEARVVRRDLLSRSFSNIKLEVRNGTDIVNKMAATLEDVLKRRAHAAEEIMRKAEELSKQEIQPDYEQYTYDRSMQLGELKKIIDKDDYDELQVPPFCRSVRKVKLRRSKHFDADVSMDATSVSVVAEEFDCSNIMMDNLYWSEGLLSTFQKNYAQDVSTNFQYFCSAQGFLRHYPGASWESLFNLKFAGDNIEDVYDCRLRPWYVSAAGAPRDVLILLDASGSMNGSKNSVVAKHFTLAMLSALTDDDRVNVLRFNVKVESPIACFNEKLVSANHVNTAAMMAAMEDYKLINETKMEKTLTYAVKLLKRQEENRDRAPSCQQAIVLLTDSLYGNFTELLKKLDPTGRIRLFVLWLHDVNGLRDSTGPYGKQMSCERDGYFGEFLGASDVTQKVFKILQVLERPLVAQRKERLTVFSDVYAHVEDPRRSELYWRQKENDEQLHRYQALRKDKNKLLSDNQRYKDWMYQITYDTHGQYYEGQELNYRLQISVSVPVFEHRTTENITVVLREEFKRNSTRVYPVNRLLGVAGVDIPLDHLKILLPYDQVGAGGHIMLLDHRGNIVLHNNIKPQFDGDILKPGYRTVDFIDLEQPVTNHKPRDYPRAWIELRNEILVDKKKGNRSMYGKNIFELGMRALLERRQYHWKRVLNHYTAVVVLPVHNRVHAVPNLPFTQKLAEEAWRSMSSTEYSVHPDWLYCRHIEPYFETREAEVRHFAKRRSDEANFAMQKLKHFFSPIEPSLLEKTYQCNEELMARLCKEVLMTHRWAREHEDPEEQLKNSNGSNLLGSTTAFFASESGLTRWQQYHAISGHADPPQGKAWSLGPGEAWYIRAAASPGTLVVHAPVAPVAKMRIMNTSPPSFTERSIWLTAARTLSSPDRAMYGVAGYHFYPQHLVDLLERVTNGNPPCKEDDTDCETLCDGKDWACVLIDEFGWIVARDGRNITGEPDEPLREHFSTVHSAAMHALLNASVFQINWIHDYQAVCFHFEEKNSAITIVPTILRSLWRCVSFIVSVTQEVAILLTILSTKLASVTADTAAERAKRRRRLWRDNQREMYERLWDERVLVNRTRFSACDRSRPIYILQNTTQANEALKRPAKACSWPLVAAKVPDTNLLLIAVYKLCPNKIELPNPLSNQQYPPDIPDPKDNEPLASKLACRRIPHNRTYELRTRPPHVRCFQHNYTQEAGYRQCGEWKPNPENSASISISSSMLIIVASLLYLILA